MSESRPQTASDPNEVECPVCGKNTCLTDFMIDGCLTEGTDFWCDHCEAVLEIDAVDWDVTVYVSAKLHGPVTSNGTRPR